MANFIGKDVDLLSYWMPILKGLKEFKEIAKAEEPELRYLIEAIDRTLSNFFIQTADEYGIKRFEDMMGIFPDEEDTLDTRRFRVLVKWNDKVPYTDEELYNRLLSICGSEDKFEINPNYKDYFIEIITHLGVKGATDQILETLEEMLPCNLVLDLKNILDAKKESSLFCAVICTTAMGYIITNDINRKYVNESPHYIATGLGRADTQIITHDVALRDYLTGNFNKAVGVGIAQTRIITNDISGSAVSNGNSTVASPLSTATVITIS